MLISAANLFMNSNVNITLNYAQYQSTESESFICFGSDNKCDPQTNIIQF